ncbi:MAG: DUF4261 domain-containing protein [Actinomycetaceae bacterium]|nr:DUF4261 domain-containing protein [Arcanobacterium sp.]MDD7505495.1 DUF4261 domain-containing protein [Actinomycetaceae bacterium]MDY6143476.1 DUF4261 domain-containing protein [Arcanobacterium sp.]
MEQLGISAIHPHAPEILSASALFSAPFDLGAAVERLSQYWGVSVSPTWDHVDAAGVAGAAVQVPNNPGDPEAEESAGARGGGDILHFSLQGVEVMMTPMNAPLSLAKGALPEHSFYVPITLFAPMARASGGVLAGENHASTEEIPEVKARRRMMSAHIVLTQVADVLMREPAAVGLFRPELGVVQPPQMVTELSETLTKGEVPLPLWVNVRIQQAASGVTAGRTLGMPLFGHLELEIADSPHTPEDVYSVIANTANYVMTSSAYLLPGQTLGAPDGTSVNVTQVESIFDKQPVIRIDY